MSNCFCYIWSSTTAHGTSVIARIPLKSSTMATELNWSGQSHPCILLLPTRQTIRPLSLQFRPKLFHQSKNIFFFPVRKFLPTNYPSLSLRHVCLWWRPHPLKSACADGLKLHQLIWPPISLRSNLSLDQQLFWSDMHWWNKNWWIKSVELGLWSRSN